MRIKYYNELWNKIKSFSKVLSISAVMFMTTNANGQTPELVGNGISNISTMYELNDELYWVTRDLVQGGQLLEHSLIKLKEDETTSYLQVQGIETAGEEVLPFNNTLILSVYTEWPNPNVGGYEYVSGKQLFQYDPSLTSSQAWKFSEINGNSESDPKKMFEFNGALYLFADGGDGKHDLYRSSTGHGASLLKNYAITETVTGPVVGDNHFYYIGGNSNGDKGIIKSDGTSGGTMHLDANLLGTTPFYLVGEVNGNLLFTGKESSADNFKLYVTDGTASGTGSLKVLSISPSNIRPKNVIKYDGKLYFIAKEASNSIQLWVSDGTPTGTKPFSTVADISTAPYPRGIVESNNKLYFASENKLYITDGTPSGTSVINAFSASNPGSAISDFFEYNGRFYFSALTSSNERQLWETTGEAGAATLVMPLVAPHDDPFTDNVVGGGIGVRHIEVNGVLYYIANYDGNSDKLYKYQTTHANLSVGELTQNDVKIYPNPATDLVHIDIENLKSVSLTSISGQQIQSWTSNTIDVSSISSGVYLMKVTNMNNETIVKRIVID